MIVGFLNIDERYDFDVAAMFWKSTNQAFFFFTYLEIHIHAPLG